MRWSCLTWKSDCQNHEINTLCENALLLCMTQNPLEFTIWPKSQQFYEFAWKPANTFKRRLHVQCYANLGDFIGAALWSIGLQSSRPLCGRKSGGTLTLILFMSTQRAAQGSFSVRPVQTEGWCGRVFEGAGLHWLLGRGSLTGQH